MLRFCTAEILQHKKIGNVVESYMDIPVLKTNFIKYSPKDAEDYNRIDISVE